MIYILGDLHGKIKLLETRLRQHNISLGLEDKLIICGDFTFIYDDSPERIDGFNKLKKLKCEILFVCGNHEDFRRINQYEIVHKYGAPMHKLFDNIFHMIRGNVYCIDNTTFFAFGGGYSPPHHPPVIWQKEEVPNAEEIEFGMHNLSFHNYSVDYIITHSAPNTLLRQIGIEPFYDKTLFTDYLDWILSTVNYKWWFCGHYHIDKDIPEKSFSIVFDKVISLVGI